MDYLKRLRERKTIKCLVDPCSSPEKDSQDVGYEQHKAHPGREALTVATSLNLLVLGDVRQGPTKYHEAGRQPGQGRPRVLLYIHLM